MATRFDPKYLSYHSRSSWKSGYHRREFRMDTRWFNSSCHLCGTYVYDDTSYSVNIDLTVNQVSEATSAILSGSYVISGIAMTITDASGSFTYYKQ